jgi:putative membrane protein
VALIVFGFAIARFGLFMQQLQIANQAANLSEPPLINSQFLGTGLVVLGVAMTVLAAWRYNQVFWQIERGAYRPSRWAVWLLTGMVTVLGLLSLPLLTRQPAAKAPPQSMPNE